MIPLQMEITNLYSAPPRSSLFTCKSERRKSVMIKKNHRFLTVTNNKGLPADQKSSIMITPGISLKQDKNIEIKAVITIRKKIKDKLLDRLAEDADSIVHAIGRGIVIQLVSVDIDPGTGSGRRSKETVIKGWAPKGSEKPYHIDLIAEFSLPADFGLPGAILVSNAHSKEVFLAEIILHGFDDGPVFFPAHTWIQPMSLTPNKRIIFSNQEFLPSQTPEGLKNLREEDLVSLRGDGKGERKMHERIYDYDVYNDLGNADQSEDLARPVLGNSSQLPYPRRCRTGRPPMKSDPKYESRVEAPNPVYVPRDEAFEDIKDKTMARGRLKGILHNLIPVLTSIISKSDKNFTSFSEIEDLYKDGISLLGNNQTDQKNIILKLLGRILNIDDRLKYDVPLIISKDRFAWLRDSEFARQTLAGVNPGNIERLREFPIMSKLDPDEYGPPESAITREIIEEELNGMTLEMAMEEKRLFILDYHDMLLPFINGMNSLKDRKAYASRTIFFYDTTGVLRPIVIELSLPPTSSEPQHKRVYTHGHGATEEWIWRLAKAHVCSNDTGVHQLVNHWLKTHACMEPCIIAAHRQLSSMHPVFKLLHPHMRYTMDINALARQSLINGGGIIEKGFSPGKFSMEISSAAYKSFWRFDMEALPADLLRRGMAEEDPSSPHGIKLVIEDYPYAADGLLIWSAIESHVADYLSLFYPSSTYITSDPELQAWWAELRSMGHPDKANEPWWPTLTSLPDLTNILTTIIWTASALHAAVNFGQYPLGGFMPTRPTKMKRSIPEEGSPEFDFLVKSPQEEFLKSLPTILESTQIMAVQDTLSTHCPDEEYLGTDPDSAPGRLARARERFLARLDEVEEVIKERNRDPRLINRTSAGVPPYELLMRSSGPGATARGIPNSISI